MDDKKIQEVLDAHKRWLRGDSEEKGNFRGAYLRSANLCGVDLSSADMYNVNLSFADLSSAYLYGANMSTADLRNANLRGSNLYDADLYGADLCNANLSDANLRGADLRKADLRSANLSGADLTGASLSGADLRSADLKGANLSGADLHDTNLDNAELSKRIVQIGPIGSRHSYTVYNADDDVVQCGCWNDYKGGTLEEFKKRVDTECPDGQYRQEYLAAIAMFEKLKERKRESND